MDTENYHSFDMRITPLLGLLFKYHVVTCTCIIITCTCIMITCTCIIIKCTCIMITCTVYVNKMVVTSCKDSIVAIYYPFKIV